MVEVLLIIILAGTTPNDGAPSTFKLIEMESMKACKQVESKIHNGPYKKSTDYTFSLLERKGEIYTQCIEYEYEDD